MTKPVPNYDKLGSIRLWPCIFMLSALWLAYDWYGLQNMHTSFALYDPKV